MEEHKNRLVPIIILLLLAVLMALGWWYYRRSVEATIGASPDQEVLQRIDRSNDAFLKSIEAIGERLNTTTTPATSTEESVQPEVETATSTESDNS